MARVRPSSDIQGSLLSRMTPDTGWRAPESLPVLDSRYKRVGFDCESDGKDWHGKSMPIGYSLGLEDGRRFYLPTGHRGGGNLDRGRVRQYLRKELAGKTLVTLSGKFDIQMARKDGIDLEEMGCNIREVQSAAALLSDQRRSFKMDDLAFDFLGKRKIEMDRSRIWELPAFEVGAYAEEDAGIPLELDDVLTPLIEAEGMGAVLDLENSITWCVCDMERNGAPIDVDTLKVWRRETRKRFEYIVTHVQKVTGLKVNPNSSHDLAQLFGLLGLTYPRTPASDKFPNGQPSFPDSFLKTVKNDLVGLLREGRTLDSLESKYLGKYERGLIGTFLYYQLHQLKSNEYGTISGRFSSSSVDKGKVGANIQQVFDPERQAIKMGYEDAVERDDYSEVPYLIRNLFKPESGYWVKADASQIEFRLFVHYSKSKRLIDAFNEAAARVRGDRENEKDIDFHQQVADLCGIRRKVAKNINFGKLFGMGKEKMAGQLGLSRAASDKLYDEYNEKFPETGQLMDEVMHVARKRGFVKTIMGRRARFPDGERLHSALNRVIQGSAGDILKIKLKQVYDLRKLLNFKMRFTVHDDINGDIASKKDAERLREVLEEPIPGLGIRVPLLFDVTVGDSWGACS